MLEILLNLDKQLFLWINNKHSTFWDVVMYWISDKYIWTPLYVFWLVYLIEEYGKKGVWICLFVIVLIFMTDGTSNLLLKENIKRLRPCHALANVHLVFEKCGGMYGFVSSHAANMFGLATYLTLWLHKDISHFGKFAFLWASLIGYSRIYLGVHYPLDVIGGAAVGIVIGWLNYKFVQTNVLPRLFFEAKA
ncbi:MAG: phosphatase PAP2 family protein [Bacteroidia bacterium]|nr:phosphatase PAP2 family protein [Bacteroidia bacterium]MDW8301884.1 phosphatase PAP2 family protein [Bacteroidia bacterium]